MANALLTSIHNGFASGAAVTFHCRMLCVDFSPGREQLINLTFQISAGDSPATIKANIQAAMIAAGSGAGYTLVATDLYYPQITRGS